ncbi:MAG: histidine kinase [Terracidiphilus sp.]|nr:histidine kinase [Terracidiphilus sp.]
MKSETAPPAKLPDESSPAPGYGPLGLRAIWIVAITTLMIFLIFLSTGHTRLSQGAIQIVVVFVYCACIGVPSIFLLTRISFRYTNRFPRLVILMQALALVCTAIAGTFLSGLILQFAAIFPRSGYWSELRESLPFSIVISLMFGLSISTYETLRYRFQAATLELRTRQVEQERAYKLLAEARLSSLQSRIHPHFLFNTLNSIAALIPSDPVRAEDTVGKLASLLRFSLNANHSGLVPLSQELKIVRDYLEIEKTRFGPRIRYEIAVPESLDDARVPPLAIQSLVENAVKHVAAQRPQGASIEVIGSCSAGSGESRRIRLEVLDDGPGFSLDAIDPDHGLGNLIARLELLYGPGGRLEVARENNRTAVRLSFPA